MERWKGRAGFAVLPHPVLPPCLLQVTRTKASQAQNLDHRPTFSHVVFHHPLLRPIRTCPTPSLPPPPGVWALPPLLPQH